MARPIIADLTDAQRRIAFVLADFEREDRPGLVPELLRRLNLAAESSLTPTLQKMERHGFVEIMFGGSHGRSRVIRLTSKGRLAAGVGGLPLFGFIPAGTIAESIPQMEEMVESKDLVPNRPGDFLLRVRGDSMVGDGILDGDLVLLRPDAEVPNGAIAAACVGDDREGTLKRVYYEGQFIRLKASNPRYPDQVVPAETVTFAGLLQSVIRHLR